MGETDVDENKYTRLELVGFWVLWALANGLAWLAARWVTLDVLQLEMNNEGNIVYLNVALALMLVAQWALLRGMIRRRWKGGLPIEVPGEMKRKVLWVLLLAFGFMYIQLLVLTSVWDKSTGEITPMVVPPLFLLWETFLGIFPTTRLPEVKGAKLKTYVTYAILSLIAFDVALFFARSILIKSAEEIREWIDLFNWEGLFITIWVIVSGIVLSLLLRKILPSLQEAQEGKSLWQGATWKGRVYLLGMLLLFGWFYPGALISSSLSTCSWFDLRLGLSDCMQRWELGEGGQWRDINFEGTGDLIAVYTTVMPNTRLEVFQEGKREAILSQQFPNGYDYYCSPDCPIAFSHDRNSLAVGFTHGVGVWDLSTHVQRIHLNELDWFVSKLAFSPDDSLLAYSVDGQVIVLEKESLEVIAQAEIETQGYVTLGFSDDSEEVYIDNRVGRFYTWAYLEVGQKPTITSNVPEDYRGWRVIINTQTRDEGGVESDVDVAWIFRGGWDVMLEGSENMPIRPGSAVFTPDGNYVIAAYENSETGKHPYGVWRTEDGSFVKDISFCGIIFCDQHPSELRFVDDQTVVFISDDQLIVWRVELE